MARQKRTRDVKKMLPLIPSGGVTDHGNLTGLGDNDHPQYLLATGKAADSDKLDGIDSTGFAMASHVHDHGALTGLGDNDHPQYLLAVRYAVRAYRDSTTFTFTTSGTIYPVPLNQESYDTHNQHNNSTNNSRLTCVKAGMYLINAVLTFAANVTGNRDLLLMKNGTTYFAQQRLEAFASGSCTLNAMAAVPLAVGDYIEMRGRQYSGGALNIYYADDSNNYLAMVRIGD